MFLTHSLINSFLIDVLVLNIQTFPRGRIGLGGSVCLGLRSIAHADVLSGKWISQTREKNEKDEEEKLNAALQNDL